ncbi:MAG: elongation factor P [Bacteroidetes bacterium]|nr:elongation factor P [Bacteroidota bacterium]
MVAVTDIKPGAVIRMDNRLYRVLDVIRHAGSGQMHGFIELKVKDMRYGHISDHRFKSTDKVEDVEIVKRQMEYLYADNEQLFFMDPETFEQLGIPKETVGPIEKFIREGTVLTVELVGDEPVAVQFPKIVELKVTMTGPSIRDAQDNTMKSAMLENGIEILVPQFIETGDIVRVDTEKVKYVERVPTKKI